MVGIVFAFLCGDVAKITFLIWHIACIHIENFTFTTSQVLCEAICEIHFQGPIWVAEPSMSKEDTFYTSFCQPLS